MFLGKIFNGIKKMFIHKDVIEKSSEDIAKKEAGKQTNDIKKETNDGEINERIVKELIVDGKEISQPENGFELKKDTKKVEIKIIVGGKKD